MEFDNGLHFRRDLVGHGYSDKELARARRRGELQSIRRGAVVPCTHMNNLNSHQQHRLAVEAAVGFAGPEMVVSHVSAAIMHGLDLWIPLLARVHMTVDSRSGGRVTRRRHVHAARLEPDEVTVIDGIAVTSVARTVVDCARTMEFEQAVVLGDSALHQKLVTPDELAAALDSAAHRAGARQARRAVAFMDGRSESVGESRSRVLIHRANLPKPDLQRVILDANGRQIGRVDFLFEEANTIGEFDGHGKYRDEGVPADVVIAEKLREDELRATDRSVARWGWKHLATPQVVVDRILWAFEIGRRAHPRTQ